MTTPQASSKGAPEAPSAVAAVLLFSSDPAGLASFYRVRLGVPLRCVTVEGLEPHFACDIGHVYVSIWPMSSKDSTARAHRGGIAFRVRDVEREFERLSRAGVPYDFRPRRTQLGIIARLRDPDGNPFELHEPLPR